MAPGACNSRLFAHAPFPSGTGGRTAAAPFLKPRGCVRKNQVPYQAAPAAPADTQKGCEATPSSHLRCAFLGNQSALSETGLGLSPGRGVLGGRDFRRGVDGCCVLRSVVDDRVPPLSGASRDTCRDSSSGRGPAAWSRCRSSDGHNRPDGPQGKPGKSAARRRCTRRWPIPRLESSDRVPERVFALSCNLQPVTQKMPGLAYSL
uniref:Uncharacterized protein LOC109694971 n=1 Tax=Castor canadensis TaxID=51338 RepID=A0A8B7VMN5_CASCN|nr:uncharacterized protein LOC109694971 [Castor canadensis]